MKKVLKVVGIILVLLLASLIVLPIIFKDDIVKLVKEETNKALNAKVDFGEFDLSLIKNFPDFYFSIETISVTGVDEFEGVELATVGELDLTVDLMSVIKGEAINVKSILIIEPKIHAKVLANGNANYLIVKEDSTAVNEVEETEEGTSSFQLSLEQFEIRDASVIYDDATFPILMTIDDFDMILKGNFTENVTDLDIDGGITAFNLTFDGIQYMKDVKILLDVMMQMNLEEMKFTFNENELRVNELPLGFDGWVAMPNDPIDMDLTFHAKETDFKEVLSMIPAAFAKDLEGVKTSGKLDLKGYAKGTFIDETYPAFGINMNVNDASFQYPDLPKSVENIQIKASVESKDGDLDHTIVDVPVFHLEMANNPFDIDFYLATPMSDPFIRAGIRGKLILDNIKDVVPLEQGDELSGTFIADLTIEGKASTLEKEDYENFKANGKIIAEKIHYKSDSLDYPVDLMKANLEFSPQFVELREMDLKLGMSDLRASGRLENFIGYAMKDDQILKGNLAVNADYLNINELAGIEPTEDNTTTETEEAVDSSTIEVVVLPKNIDFTTTANIKKLTFDNLDIVNIIGAIDYINQKVALKNTSMELLKGKMIMDGFYETTDSLKPTFDFNMNIVDFDLQETVIKFNSVEQMAPLAKYGKGLYSTTLKINGALDDKMEPIFETFSGEGDLNTKSIAIEGYKPMAKIADLIKYDKINPMTLKDINISYQIVNGKVFVKPFTTHIGKTDLTISGSNSFDRTIDYVFSFAIPREEFGGSANKAIDGLLSQAASKGVDLGSAVEVINIDVTMTGPASDPKIGTNFKKSATDAKQALKDKAKEELDKAKEELKKKAQEELEKQKKEAEEKARQELEKQKEKAKEELEKQKEAAKDKLKDEAGKKLKGLFK